MLNRSIELFQFQNLVLYLWHIMSKIGKIRAYAVMFIPIKSSHFLSLFLSHGDVSSVWRMLFAPGQWPICFHLFARQP